MKRDPELESEARRVFFPRQKLRRSIYLLPSMLTVGNIACGYYAIISILNDNYQNAAIALGIAIVLDGLDGRVARMANATSDFGLQLDSLADVISFGIVPAVLVYTWGLSELGKFAQFSAFLFLICGAMRLARFNTQTTGLKQFAGLPIPAGAGCIAATVHFVGQPPDTPVFTTFLVGMTYTVSLLMISTLRYPSLKQLELGRQKSHRIILILALLVAGVIWYSKHVLLIVAYGYMLSGVVLRAYHFLKYRSKGDGNRSAKARADR